MAETSPCIASSCDAKLRCVAQPRFGTAIIASMMTTKLKRRMRDDVIAFIRVPSMRDTRKEYRREHQRRPPPPRPPPPLDAPPPRDAPPPPPREPLYPPPPRLGAERVPLLDRPRDDSMRAPLLPPLTPLNVPPRVPE